MEQTEQVRENIARVKERVRDSAGGREVAIVAATKTVPAETVRMLPELGINIAGENRAQELVGKYEAVRSAMYNVQCTMYNGQTPPLKWHFIGRLQTNKVKYIVDKVSMVQSVDRPELAAEISRCLSKSSMRGAGDLSKFEEQGISGAGNLNGEAGKSGKAGNLDILIEVNAGGEANKGGVKPDELIAFAHTVADKFKNLKVRGMMPVLPVGAPDKLYKEMAALYERLKRELPDIGYLSMGMSGDFERAVAAGANMVRVGSAIFGERK